MVAHEQNGMESIDTVLSDLDIRDPLTNQVLRAEDVFADWAIANFWVTLMPLMDVIFTAITQLHHLHHQPKTFDMSDRIRIFDVAQFGVDYVEIACDGDYTLSFKGNTSVAILPIDPYWGSITSGQIWATTPICHLSGLLI